MCWEWGLKFGKEKRGFRDGRNDALLGRSFNEQCKTTVARKNGGYMESK